MRIIILGLVAACLISASAQAEDLNLNCTISVSFAEMPPASVPATIRTISKDSFTKAIVSVPAIDANFVCAGSSIAELYCINPADADNDETDPAKVDFLPTTLTKNGEIYTGSVKLDSEVSWPVNCN